MNTKSEGLFILTGGKRVSIKNSIIDLVGNTPLLALRRIEKKENVDANLIAKLEYFNPAGSVKDRVAKAIILDALEKGEINKDTILVEPTSGNTGIGLASVAAALGMKLIITMPETMSIERRKLMKAYGAELVLTDGTKGMKGAIAKANEIVEKYAIQEYKIEPEYRGDNLPFFEENVFLYEEDILSKHLSMQDLMRNQILNSNDFGKLSVCSNGDMYTNELSPTVGNIWTNDVRKLIYKEMTEGHSWLRIRDQKPCCDCIYQWLCPSPSNYELAIGKPNLCHVKP